MIVCTVDGKAGNGLAVHAQPPNLQVCITAFIMISNFVVRDNAFVHRLVHGPDRAHVEPLR